MKCRARHPARAQSLKLASVCRTYERGGRAHRLAVGGAGQLCQLRARGKHAHVVPALIYDESPVLGEEVCEILAIVPVQEIELRVLHAMHELFNPSGNRGLRAAAMAVA